MAQLKTTTINGQLHVTDTTNTNNANDASFTTAGGAYITRNLYTGGTTVLASNTVINGPISANDDTDSTSTSTGSIICAGGVGIGKNVQIGGYLGVLGNAVITGSAGNTLEVNGQTKLYNGLTVSSGNTFLKETYVDGDLNVYDGYTLYVDTISTFDAGEVSFNDDIYVYGNLDVDGAANLNNGINAKYIYTVNGSSFGRNLINSSMTGGNTTLDITGDALNLRAPHRMTLYSPYIEISDSSDMNDFVINNSKETNGFFESIVGSDYDYGTKNTLSLISFNEGTGYNQLVLGVNEYSSGLRNTIYGSGILLNSENAPAGTSFVALRANGEMEGYEMTNLIELYPDRTYINRPLYFDANRYIQDTRFR